MITVIRNKSKINVNYMIIPIIRALYKYNILNSLYTVYIPDRINRNIEVHEFIWNSIDYICGFKLILNNCSARSRRLPGIVPELISRANSKRPAQ